MTNGLSIPFNENPFQKFKEIFNIVIGETAIHICDNEVASMLQKGARIEKEVARAHFVSGIFVIPKKTDGYRTIVNLKALNVFVSPVPFKMENVNMLKEMVRPGDFL